MIENMLLAILDIAPAIALAVFIYASLATGRSIPLSEMAQFVGKPAVTKASHPVAFWSVWLVMIVMLTASIGGFAFHILSDRA